LNSQTSVGTGMDCIGRCKSSYHAIVDTLNKVGGRRDRMVVGFTTTYAIGAYRH